MPTEMLDTVVWLRGRLGSVLQSIDDQVQDLQPFIEGHRYSKYPLGSKLLINAGREIEALAAELAQRLQGFKP